VKRSAELQLQTRLIGAANHASHELPPWLVADLRADHAGEAGAVMMYRGILSVSKDPHVRAFAERHLRTECGHLASIAEIMPARSQTQLLPIWRMMGWLTGALSALLGPRAIFANVQAVETFVDHHYQEQIIRLSAEGPFADVRQLLADCRQDEIDHRDEAAGLTMGNVGHMAKCWQVLIAMKFKVAVWLARKF